MAQTNHLIARGDVAALMPEDVSAQVWELAIQQSAALTRFPRITLSTTQQRIPVLAGLPTAYWVDGDTGLKQTTAQAWKNKFIDVSELAVIVPVPEAVLDDAGFDLWGQVQPRLVEAIGKKVDEAVFLGMDKPGLQPSSLSDLAITTGNWVARGSVATGGQDLGSDGDLADDFNYLMRLVEDDGYDVGLFVLNPRYRSRFRGLRAEDGQLLYVPGVPNSSPDTVYGITSQFALRGLWALQTGWGSNDAKVEGFAGDETSVVMGIRQDIRYKFLEEATIHNSDGSVAFNLAQQDMVALRATFRVGWQYRDLPTPEKPNAKFVGTHPDEELERFPWAVITDDDPTATA